MHKKISIIFPHQLFLDNPLLKQGNPIYLIEEYLFFKQYKFHKQKISFHRASMKSYESHLVKKGCEMIYISSDNALSDIRNFVEHCTAEEVFVIDPTDFWLSKRLNNIKKKANLHICESPLFINTKKDNQVFFKEGKKKFFHAVFYKQQRKRLHVLMQDESNPVGEKWSYDTENRKRYPKDKKPPTVKPLKESTYWEESLSYTEKHFKANYGIISNHRTYPINHEESIQWFNQFLDIRFKDFGAYEDAIVRNESILHHSVLSPLMNVGLLTPQVILSQSLAYGVKNDIPMNSIEGFVRQIIGWREFIRGMYEVKGSYARTLNYWGFTRKIPKSFYTGETGILPVDETIQQVLKTGYCHHIERLMILGNFMLLCEFDPDEVYRWFMELFIDAYDWVMVPNVYGMSQFADGGTFATKPYISGANYLRKMSNYPKGKWQDIWDGLFWRFLAVHRETFANNPRMSLLLKTLDNMSSEKRNSHFEQANLFIHKL